MKTEKMSETKFEIKGEFYSVEFTFEATRIYEQLTNKSITTIKWTWDVLTWMYCLLKGANPETFKMNFDEYVKFMNKHPELLAEFQILNLEPTNENEPKENVKKKPGIKQNFIMMMLFALLLVSPVLIPIISVSGLILTSLKILYGLTKIVGKKSGQALAQWGQK